MAETASEVLRRLEIDQKFGLSTEQASERLIQYGKNRLHSPRPTPVWIKFLNQFRSTMIALLVVASIVSGFLGDWLDAAAILAIVVLNASLGFVQEERAGKALEALKQLTTPFARVRRNGRLESVPAEDIVPGDILVLEAGDKVPADAQVIESYSLQAIESSLTGESTPVEKNVEANWADDTPLAERSNCLYAATSIVQGKADAVVIATGMQTELGKIAGVLLSEEQQLTPLQTRLAQLGRLLVCICLSLVAVVFVLQWLRGGSLAEVFLTSVSLAVAAIPEGLPAVVTVTLAIGLQRMSKRNALIRKLPSVETLGCVTVICSDKTGTLTRNEMTARRLWTFDQFWNVDGDGYLPNGSIAKETAPSPTSSSRSLADSNHTVSWLAQIAGQCNNSEWRLGNEPNTSLYNGDPTEIALKVLAHKSGDTPVQDFGQLRFEIPFDSDRKRMSQVYETPNGQWIMLLKGAPESVLSVSNWVLLDDQRDGLDETKEALIRARNSQMADEALRVLGIGFRYVSSDPKSWATENDFTFVGLAGLMDPPRSETPEAVRKCIQAGIRPVMITGDHPATALAIAKRVGIATEADTVLLGSTIEKSTDHELRELVLRHSVVARVSAQHKLRVVNAWKSHNHVVAMTGDGVNDAPAVKAADIGIVMGITGTDVAKEAADMVLTDDNFASIVNAVEEGRGIYNNLQKFLQFLLACNTSEVLFMFIASLVGWPSPLAAIQILWINLVTDGLPALALASEPIERGVMNKPPRPKEEPVITWKRGITFLVHGSLMACAALIGFYWAYQNDSNRLEEARAVAFCIMTFSQIFYSMACRSLSVIMPRVGFFSNPFLLWACIGSIALQMLVMAFPWSAHVLGLQAMPWNDLPIVILLSLVPVTLVEVYKMIRPLLFARTR